MWHCAISAGSITWLSRVQKQEKLTHCKLSKMQLWLPLPTKTNKLLMLRQFCRSITFRNSSGCRFTRQPDGFYFIVWSIETGLRAAFFRTCGKSCNPFLRQRRNTGRSRYRRRGSSFHSACFQAYSQTVH